VASFQNWGIELTITSLDPHQIPHFDIKDFPRSPPHPFYNSQDNELPKSQSSREKVIKINGRSWDALEYLSKSWRISAEKLSVNGEIWIKVLTMFFFSSSFQWVNMNYYFFLVTNISDKPQECPSSQKYIHICN